MSRGLLFVFASFIFSNPAFCQTIADTAEGQVDEMFETALEGGTKDLEDSEYAELLFQLSANPIDVNEAAADDLLQVPGIDPLLASRIVSFRDEHRLKKLNELLLVEGINQGLFRQIRAFLKVETLPQEQSKIHFTSRTSRGLQDRQGYRDGTYAGTPYKLFNRLTARQTLGRTFYVEFGGLAEKDPGEKSPADFATGYLSVGTTSKSLRCVVGNFVVESGQGLVFWRASGPTKGSEVIAATSKNPRGLQPNISSDENSFLRGCAIQASFDGFDVTALYSQKSINANVNEFGTITSFDAAGLFRMPSEFKRKASSTERIIGVNSNAWIVNGLRMGLRGYTSSYENPVELSGVNSFHGKKATLAGFDVTYTTGYVGAFGEVAADHRRSVALITGIVLEPVAGLTTSLVARYYPKSFISLHGCGFGESGSQIQNEQGVYASVRMSVVPWLNVSTFYDQFAFPGPSGASLLPSSGNESMLVIQAKPKETALLQLHLRRKDRSDGQLLPDEFLRSSLVVGHRIQVNYRATLEWWPSTSIRWRSRFEKVRVDYSPSGIPANGYLFFQDIRLKASKRFSIDGRVAVYETDSYDSRIYEFESELRGTFVNPALFGKGVRLYVLTRYEVGSLEFSAKYASTIMPGVRSLSSGANTILGDIDNQVSAQIDITL